ncbi:hypothetical protein [Albimonas donghaensis]|uniref:hypothetical protein n=1 Tax=Albimonas donghaensis TaxID=356660 RepID=UPI000B87B5F8|nr:hypothetical protein [Albimonas donghaensis]
MNCYFPGCTAQGTTKEHVPPKSFFPKGERDQLLTVKSCEKHNNQKSKDDIYVLAQICMNASPSNRAREVYQTRIAPQLSFKRNALKRRISKGKKRLPDGTFKYRVESRRLDCFFDHLCYGLINSSTDMTLPEYFSLSHIYHNLLSNADSSELMFQNALKAFYSKQPPEILDFGTPNLNNERIYAVRIFGVPNFQSSITITHKFFGKFEVTSMLTRITTSIPVTEAG